MYLRNLLVNWNVCRIVRIIAGVSILVMGIWQMNLQVIAFGALFIALGLFTTQCCSTGSCNVDLVRRRGSPAKNTIEFEEIK